MATLDEVADYCGVSASTVSRALRNLPNIALDTRLRVQEAAERLGYVVSPSASGLVTGRYRVIAIAAPPLGPWFYAQAIRGIESVLNRHGFSFFLIDTAVQDDGSRRPFSRTSIEKRSDAVIALGIDLTVQEREDLAKVGKPAVVVGAAVPALHSIGLDDRAAARLAMRHLLSLGHRRIAHIGGDNDYGIENAVALTRRQEWERVLREVGSDVDARWFLSGHFRVNEAKTAALDLLSRPDRPSAIFAASDEMAFGVILAARELRLSVPEDLSVIGIDDHEWSAAFDLTTVHQDPFAQGALAASTVLSQLTEGLSTGTEIHVPFSLVVRGTTAPL